MKIRNWSPFRLKNRLNHGLHMRHGDKSGDRCIICHPHRIAISCDIDDRRRTAENFYLRYAANLLTKPLTRDIILKI